VSDTGGWVGVLSADLHLPDAQSIKAKRKELQRVKHALARHCAASVAEVDHHDLWQRARISMAIVGRDARDVEERLDAAARRLHGDEAFLVLEEGRDIQAIETEPAYLTGTIVGDEAE
jgi:uncharacterized protein YlxP (DUF503 family)